MSEMEDTKEMEMVAKGDYQFPYNLNNLFKMDYSFEVLKLSIEYLAKEQRLLKDRMSVMENREPEQVTREIVK